MGLLRNIKILLTGNLDERGEYATPLDPWISEVENPTPRERDPEFVKVESPKPVPVKAVPVVVDADPWGPVKKPRGSLNLLKLLVTVYALMNLAAGALLLSNNLTITVASVLIFVPNAAFLLLLRGKL